MMVGSSVMAGQADRWSAVCRPLPLLSAALWWLMALELVAGCWLVVDGWSLVVSCRLTIVMPVPVPFCGERLAVAGCWQFLTGG